jgi:MFS family permease
MARDLRLFYVFRLLATSYLWVPVFVHFMDARGLGFDQIMLLGAIYCGVVILVEIPTGAFADRIGRRPSMMAGALAMVASCITAYFAHSFAVFVVAEALAAVSMSLCSGADSAYLFDLLHANGRSDEYARHESTASAWHQAGNTVAFAAGGLIGSIDLALPYLCTAGVSAIAFAVALAMRGDRPFADAGVVTSGARPTRPAAEAAREYVRHMSASIGDVVRSRPLAWVIAYSAVVFVLLRATIYLYQPYLQAQEFSVAGTGFVFAGVYFVATFVAHRVDALRRAVGEDLLVWGLLGMLASSFLLLPVASGPWVLALLAVQAVAMGVYSPLVKPLLNREIPTSERRATILSVESIARRSMMGVFAPIAGYYGPRLAMELCGWVGLAGLLVLAMLGFHAPTRRRREVAAAIIEEPSAPPVTSLD